MGLWFFKKKDDTVHKKIDDVNKSLTSSFSNLKKDMSEVGGWISHFKNKHDNHDNNFEELRLRVANIERDLEEMKTTWTRVQTGVQTRVQTRVQKTDVRFKQMSVQANTLEKLRNLTVMERGIIWVLLNSDTKVRYEDLCLALNKNKSTLRGQINSIKLKSPELVKEEVENDGTKKFYIEENVKSEIIGGGEKAEVSVGRRKRKKDSKKGDK